jgi:hypothetical protein
MHTTTTNHKSRGARRFLSSVLCPPSSVLRPLSSVLCPPSSVFRPLSSAPHAALAPYYLWMNLIDGSRVCSQLSLGQGWKKWAGRTRMAAARSRYRHGKK